MKTTFPLKALLAILTFVLGLTLTSVAQADIVWMEDFDAYNEGDSVDGQTTSTGAGTLETVNSVAVDTDNHLLLDANGGTERMYVTSNANAQCGCFGLDLAITGTPDTPGNDQVFVQLLEGQTFSTNGAPAPNFNFALRTQQGISTDETNLSSIKVFFNTSGQDFTYTAPDGTQRTLASGLRQQWVGSTLINTGGGSANGSTAPTSINTIAFATFNGQSGQQFHFDNMFLDRFVHVPEPSSLALLFGVGAIGFARRRK